MTVGYGSDGGVFIKDLRLLGPPDLTWNGVPAYRVYERRWVGGQLTKVQLASLGLHKVGYDVEYDNGIYVKGWVPSLLARFFGFMTYHVYWSLLRWLYDNGRVFQVITPGERFSWRYFTPYVWGVKLKRIVARCR